MTELEFTKLSPLLKRELKPEYMDAAKDVLVRGKKMVDVAKENGWSRQRVFQYVDKVKKLNGDYKKGLEEAAALKSK
jgi:TrfB plasmid transcriptional repressor